MQRVSRPLIETFKQLIVRHWPVLRLRTILLGVLVFTAALPGIGAIFLRVYENALVRRTEAELVAQSAALAASAAAIWPGAVATPGRVVPEGSSRVEPWASGYPAIDVSTEIDLYASPILSERPAPRPAGGAPDPQAQRVADQLAPALAGTRQVTLAAIVLLDSQGVILNGPDRGASLSAVPEVSAALAGRPVTVLRHNSTYQTRTVLEIFSRAATIRLHHARPITVNGRTVGVVLVSRSPRALLRGLYEDRGKIALGVAVIFVLLLGLSAVLVRAIVRPVESLSAASRALARGQRIHPKASALKVVEIDRLFADFEAMADSIETRSAYLKHFAAAVSHEFKTPLAGLRGAIELLQDHAATMSPDERTGFLANMAADTDRLSLLVRRLLDLVRADMSVPDPAARANIAAVLAVAADAVTGPGFGVDVAAIARGTHAAIAPPTLETILLCVLDNARQAGADRVTAHLSRHGDRLTLHLANTGPPIPAADRERIFEPFFTSKRADGGTGIGLSIARSLSTGAGGTLVLESGDGPVIFALELGAG